MGLDYTNGCVNFRDVGEFINLIKNKDLFIEGKIVRGGSIDYIKNLDEIGNAGSIINIRNGPDPMDFKCDYFHFPMTNKVEKYDTSQKGVKKWLNEIIAIFENPNLKYPVFIHCLSGKDRTGIVIAALLLILEIDKEIIKEEYLLCDGEVKEELIALAIEGMKDVKTYFDRVDILKVRDNLIKEVIKST